MSVLVLANIVIGSILLIHIGPLKTRIRHILLVEAPANSTSFEEIDDGLRIGVDSPETVVYDVVGAGTASYHIVWL